MVEAQPLKILDTAMAANSGRGKKKAFQKRPTPTLEEEEEDWDKQIEREQAEQANQASGTSTTEGRVRPKAGSSDSD